MRLPLQSQLDGPGVQSRISAAPVAGRRARAGRFRPLYAPGALVPGHGHNFILYSNETKEGGTLLVGVLDRHPGGADPDVKVAHIPGGRVITAPHFGDYAKMGDTYDVLHAEVKARGLKRIWMSLEVYGDWSNDPANVRTDLYFYLGVAI